MSDLPLTLHLWKTGDISRDKNFSPCQVPNSWPWFILLEWNGPLHSLTPLEWSNTQTFWCPPSPALPTSSQFMETKVAAASRNWAVLTRYCIFLPATLTCPLSTLQCWCPGNEAWPGPCFWERSSELPSAYSCPPGTRSMSLLRACTSFTRLPLESWDPGPLMATQQPKPPSRARVRSGIWPWGWASGVLRRQWRQSLEARAGLSALCDVGQNQGRKG